MKKLLPFAPLLLAASAAHAHTGAGLHEHAGFFAGLLHPLTGFDHLAAMLAVGMWSALALRRAWLAPAAFVAMLLAGALAGTGLPLVEPMIAASLLALGLLLAVRRALPAGAALALVGGFAFFHGAAHGQELAGGPALAGMVLATACLHAVGLSLGRLVLARHRWLPLVSGAALGLSGTALLLRLA